MDKYPAGTKLDELQKITQPLVEYLRTNYDPHTTIIIQDDLIRLVREELGVSFPFPDDY